MWQEGRFEIENNRYFYRAKIEEGFIEKLIIHENYQPKRLIVTPIALYDDGWVVKPRSSITKKALECVFMLLRANNIRYYETI